MRITLGVTLAAFLGLATAAAAETVSTLPAKPPRTDVHWSFQDPIFGHYDRAQLQRGFQVYKEVCSACHSLNRIAFHNLSEPGGPGFTEEQAKAIAAGYKIPDEPNSQNKGQLTDSSGNPVTRPGTIADHFPPPFPNEEAARAANNGAAPPDLSLIVKARAGGPNYVFSILTGFHKTPPANFKVLPNKYYNEYFDGRNISMPPPLADGSVTFSDGSPNDVEHEAEDIVAFLTWASEPKMEERKELGFGVVIFLLVLSGLLYLSYRRVWADKH
ncbi:MAG TPA: cytochrome c1 [Rhizomicrobium sp.]|nr:cytochrome c1 [Rhizomicrobium sp.]